MSTLPTPTKSPRVPSELSLSNIRMTIVGRTPESLTIRIWNTDVADDLWYELHRSTSEGGEYTLVASEETKYKTTHLQFVDEDLQPNTTYYYRARACNRSGCTVFADESLFAHGLKPQPGTTEALGQVDVPLAPLVWQTKTSSDPLGKAAGAIWVPVGGANYYRIDAPGYINTEVSAPQTSYDFGTRADGIFRSYGVGEFTIQTCNKEGCSAPVGPKGILPEHVTAVGVCEIGLELRPGEGCPLDDEASFVYIEAATDSLSELHNICVVKVTTAGSSGKCTGYGMKINQNLYVQELESGKGFRILRNSVARPRTTLPDSVAGDAERHQTGTISFASISAGARHTCGVPAEAGSVACWGDDEYGQATPPEGTFTTVSAGQFHACGVKTDGAVVCWGRVLSGQAKLTKRVPRSLSFQGVHIQELR